MSSIDFGTVVLQERIYMCSGLPSTYSSDSSCRVVREKVLVFVREPDVQTRARDGLGLTSEGYHQRDMTCPLYENIVMKRLFLLESMGRAVTSVGAR